MADRFEAPTRRRNAVPCHVKRQGWSDLRAVVDAIEDGGAVMLHGLIDHVRGDLSDLDAMLESGRLDDRALRDVRDGLFRHDPEMSLIEALDHVEAVLRAQAKRIGLISDAVKEVS